MEKCFAKPDAGQTRSWEDKLTDQLEQADERIKALGIVEGLIDKAERPADAAAAFLNLVGGLLLDGDQAVRSNVLRAIYKNRAHLSMEQVAPHMRGLLLGLEETIVAVPQSSGGGKGKAPSKPPKDKRLETRNAASSLLGWLRTDMQADFAALAPQGFSMATAKLLGNVLTTAESTDQPAASNSEARAEDLRFKSEVQGGSANAVSEINALKEELELWRSGQKTLVQEENVDTGETSTQEMSRSKRPAVLLALCSSLNGMGKSSKSSLDESKNLTTSAAAFCAWGRSEVSCSLTASTLPAARIVQRASLNARRLAAAQARPLNWVVSRWCSTHNRLACERRGWHGASRMTRA